MRSFRTLFVISILMNFISLLAQPILLEFHKTERLGIKFPCKDITSCIDTLYDKGDTLFIKLADNRAFSWDSYNELLICSGIFYGVEGSKFVRSLDIAIPNDNYNFIEMQIYDEVYLFNKSMRKNRYILDDVLFLGYSEAVFDIFREHSLSFSLKKPLTIHTKSIHMMRCNPHGKIKKTRVQTVR